MDPTKFLVSCFKNTKFFKELNYITNKALRFMILETIIHAWKDMVFPFLIYITCTCILYFCIKEIMKLTIIYCQTSFNEKKVYIPV